jgi:RNA polymerase sigma-70 factor (ECF subfamily)
MGAIIWPALHKMAGVAHTIRRMREGQPDSKMVDGPAGRTSDEALAEALRAGNDTAAFSALVNRYRTRVICLARRILGSSLADEADDVAQEAFVAAYQHRAEYRTGSPFRPWLYRIAVNRCLDRLRAKSRRPELADIDEDLDSAGLSSEEPLSALLATEQEARLQVAVEALPAKYRAVFILRHMEDLSYEEIAAATELPIGTVKTHLFRARAALRHALAGYLGD